MWGKNLILMTSACPVCPVQISLYVGLGKAPPAYPEITSNTPSIFSKTASVHQKHPPPIKAKSGMVDLVIFCSSFGIVSFAGAENNLRQVKIKRMQKLKGLMS